MKCIAVVAVVFAGVVVPAAVAYGDFDVSLRLLLRVLGPL